MERLVLRSSGFTDDELLRLKCNYIYAENEFVTAKGLNRLLRQWKKKERDITDITIGFDTSFGTRNFQTILDGLDANPIWTPDLHEHSLIAKIKLEEFDPMLTGDPDHIYSICRSDDINNTRFLLLSQGRFEVIKEENEAEFLMEYLTAEQYYILFGKCSYCDMKFCRHRRQYSTQRLKILYPRLYKLITFGFKGLMYHFGLLRVEKVLLGERPFTRPPLFEYERMNYESGFCRLLSNLRVLFFDHV